MAKAACKCKEVECEECPEWIFTFADLVMLMMGFFVVLWVLKPAPGKNDDPSSDPDWIKVAARIREAFNYLPDPQSKDPIDIQMLLNKLEKLNPMQGEGLGGKTRMRPEGPEGPHKEVQIIRQGQQSGVGGKVLFEAGDAALTPQAIATLNDLFEKIKGHRLVMLVKGHTALDDFPEGIEPQKQMELSIRRAKAVQDYLVTRGVEPDVLRVVGCSVFEPVVQRDYRPGAQRPNRRVEVEVTTLNVEDLQGSAPPPTGTLGPPPPADSSPAPAEAH